MFHLAVSATALVAESLPSPAATSVPAASRSGLRTRASPLLAGQGRFAGRVRWVRAVWISTVPGASVPATDRNVDRHAVGPLRAGGWRVADVGSGLEGLSSAGGGANPRMAAHCKSIAGMYEQVALEYDGMAQFHQLLAREPALSKA